MLNSTRWFSGLLIALTVVLAPARVLAQTPTTQAAARPIRIVLVGDSTVTDEAGWGPGFKAMLGSRVECINTAVGGRSSKSFRDEGRWEKALALKGDYVLIQFGHNDEKGKGPERETEPETTYRANMIRYVDDVRAAGGQPILVTSMVRRQFDKTGQMPETNLTRYAVAVRQIAQEKHVPLIDLNKLSHDFFEPLGVKASDTYGPLDRKTNGPDRTHLNAKGSSAMGRIVAEELKKAVPALAPHIQESAAEPASTQKNQ